jgi:hypothetical protein
MTDTTDRHVNARDRKRKRRKYQQVMRGNRSVFLIEQELGKRAKAARDKQRRED